MHWIDSAPGYLVPPWLREDYYNRGWLHWHQLVKVSREKTMTYVLDLDATLPHYLKNPWVRVSVGYSPIVGLPGVSSQQRHRLN